MYVCCSDFYFSVLKRHLRCSGSSDWPSPAEMVALGTRVIIAGSEPSTLIFSTDTDAIEVCECECGRLERARAQTFVLFTTVCACTLLFLSGI